MVPYINLCLILFLINVIIVNGQNDGGIKSKEESEGAMKVDFGGSQGTNENKPNSAMKVDFGGSQGTNENKPNSAMKVDFGGAQGTNEN